MSLDVDLMVMKPTSVFNYNITHNLGRMAKAVSVSKELTLYDVLWRPDEHGFTLAHEIADYLDVGYHILKSDPGKYEEFNPENGWGTYHGLCAFVETYADACFDNPFAELSVSR